MAKDLKKFVNLRFLRTVDLSLLRRLLDPYGAVMTTFDMAVFDGPQPAARNAVQAFLAGPEENYPADLIGDLHRIAELGTANGLRVLLDSAARRGESLSEELAEGGDAERLDPKEIALRAYLDLPDVFEMASDILSYTTMASYSEFAGSEEGVEPHLNVHTKSAFEAAAAELLQGDMRSRFCRAGWYEDADEINIVVTHGAPLRSTEIIEGDEDRVISFREAEHAVLSYSSISGRLKVGGMPKALRSKFAEVFASTMLERPRFMSDEDSQNLYSLGAVERAGFGFTFNHAYDSTIRSVQITEVQVDRIATEQVGGSTKPLWSVVVRDPRENALRRLGETAPHIEFTSGAWRLNHMAVRVVLEVDGRLTRVPVKLKPPGAAMFKRYRFEHRIMTLLRRNGLAHDRNVGAASIAAE